MLKKRLNTLNIITNSEIEHKRLIPGQKELLNLFDDLSNIFLTDKTLMSWKDKKENKGNKNEDEDDYYDYENQNKAIDQNKIMKEKNDNVDKIIDKSKPFEDQIKSFKRVENLDDYYYYDDDFDDKELKYTLK